MEKEPIKVPVVAGVVIKKDGKFLLVQEKQPRAYGLWNFPAGKVDVGESIEQAAVREAREESGYEVELIRKIGIYQETATEPPKHAFEAKIIGGELQIDPDELLDARWFTFNEIKGMREKLRGGWIINAIESLKMEPSKSLAIARKFLGQKVKVIFDRPIGTPHPIHKELLYEANYGYIPDTLAPDGENLDAYYLGVHEPLKEAEGKCIAIIHRENDDDDKLIVVPEGMEMADKEILKAVHFKEQHFQSVVMRS